MEVAAHAKQPEGVLAHHPHLPALEQSPPGQEGVYTPASHLAAVQRQAASAGLQRRPGRLGDFQPRLGQPGMVGHRNPPFQVAAHLSPVTRPRHAHLQPTQGQPGPPGTDGNEKKHHVEQPVEKGKSRPDGVEHHHQEQDQQPDSAFVGGKHRYLSTDGSLSLPLRRQG